MHHFPNLLKSRHGVYYLRTFHNGKESRLSLRTKDWALAKLAMSRHHLGTEMTNRTWDLVLPSGVAFNNIQSDSDVAQIKSLLESGQIAEAMRLSQQNIEEIQRHLQMTPEGGRAGRPTPPTPPAVAPAKTKPFDDAVVLYLGEKKLDNTQKTLDEKRGTYDEFIALFGNPDINMLGSEQAISFKNRMISDGFNALRINKKLSFMKDFFNYARRHKLYFEANPFADLAISKKSKLKVGVQSYEPFTDDELKLIFENPDYAKYMCDPDYLWLPFLALFTGARIESLASLTVDQVVKDGDIWFFDIRKDKNANSIRKIPLHERIVESSFMKYVEGVRAAGHTQLFPHIKPGKNGYSRNCSRRFGQYLDLLGIKDSRKVFHSFRSNAINQMTNAGVHAKIIMGLVGHYEQSQIDFSSAHMLHYQKAKPLQILKAAIDTLEYDIKFAAH